MNEQAYASLLLIWVMLISVHFMILALGIGKHIENCYRKLDGVSQQQLGKKELSFLCWGESHPERPPAIDFGSQFSKNVDAPILCFLAENISELEDQLRCKFEESSFHP